MSTCTDLHIIVPGLCGPLAEVQSLETSTVFKKWCRTLSKARCNSTSTGIHSVLNSIFKLQVQGEFPSAALTLLAHNQLDESQYCMHADPVHLQADMDHALLTSSEDLNISSKEAELMCAALNQHFKQDGLDFISLTDDQWLVFSKQEIQLSTTPLVEAVGRNINFLLPGGEHGSRWKQVLTEAQMLMFSHDVNEKRDAQAEMSINSLWFHGSGTLPANVENDKIPEIDSVCSNQAMLKGIANLKKSDYLMVPDSVAQYIDYLSGSNLPASHVLHLSELEHLVNYSDVNLWLEQLVLLLDAWLYPILNLAYKKKINVTLHPCHGKQYYFTQYDFLKFWRRGKRQQHVSCY